MDNGPASIAFLDRGTRSERAVGGMDAVWCPSSTSLSSVGYSGLKHEGDPEETQGQMACLRYAGLPNDVGRTDLDGHCRHCPPSRPNLISKFSAVADITHRHLRPGTRPSLAG